MKFEFKSLFDLQSAFPDEQSCIDHLENMIWGDMIISPFDATSRSTNAKVTNTVAKILENTSMSRLVLFLTILKLNFVNGLWQFGL